MRRHPRQLARPPRGAADPWRERFPGRPGGGWGLFVASHSGLTYVRGPEAPQRPYASTPEGAAGVSGWPLEVPQAPRPVVRTEGGTATIYSTDLPDHIAQARDVLPQMLREQLGPSRLRALPGRPNWGSPALEPEPRRRRPPASASRRARRRCLCSELCTALAAVWAVVTGQPPTRAAVDLAAARIGLETGLGKSCWNYNLGNVKATPSWKGDFCCFACNEILKDAQAAGYVARPSPAPTAKAGARRGDHHGGAMAPASWFLPDNAGCRFRAFAFAQRGVADHLALLQRRFKAAWPALLAGDVATFVRALRQAGCSPPTRAPYLAGVRGVLRGVQKLDYALPGPALEEAAACVDGLCDDERDRVLARLGTRTATRRRAGSFPSGRRC